MAFSTPTAYWKLDESSGNAADSVGGFTLTNTNTATYAAGKINNGANFVAASSQLLSNTAVTMGNGTNAFAVSLWTKTSGTQLTPLSISRSVADDTRWFLELRHVNASGFALADLGFIGTPSSAAQDVSVIGSTNISDNNWHHWVVNCYNAASKAVLELYIDNVLIGTSTHATDSYSTPTNFEYVTVGGGHNYNTPDNFYRYFDGMIDEVGIWDNYTLTAANVSTLWNGGAGKSYPFTTSTPSSNFLMMGVG